MRVLQVIDFMPNTSGGSRFVVNLAIELKSKGIDVDVLLIDGEGSHFIDELCANQIVVRSLGYSINRFNPIYAIKISKYLNKYDIVHVHIFPSSYQVALAKFFNKKSAPIILTEHSSFNRRASNPFFKYIEKIMYSRFDLIVCLSEQVQNFVYEKLNFNKFKLPIIQNAINGKKIYNSTATSRAELGFSSSDFILLMSARIAEPKNHKIVIEAMRLLPSQIKIIFAGEGILLNEMKNLVNEYGIPDRVQFLGSRSDIFSLMKMADVNILASNYEGLSLAALEAMSIGKPFIASNVDGLDFVVNDSKYLFENNADSLSKLILKLYEDPQFYETAAKNMLLRSKDFDIDVMTEKYIDLYNYTISRVKV